MSDPKSDPNDIPGGNWRGSWAPADVDFRPHEPIGPVPYRETAAATSPEENVVATTVGGHHSLALEEDHFRQGATSPPLRVSLLADGRPVDTRGQEVRVLAVSLDKKWRIEGTVPDGEHGLGRLTYEWAPDDLANAGTYELQVTVGPHIWPSAHFVVERTIG